VNRLNELADRLEQAMGGVTVKEIVTLLRAAAEETVGTEWDDDPVRFPYPTRARQRHNSDLHAARLAIADLKAERDDMAGRWHIARTLCDAKQRAIDEAAVIASHSDPCQLTFDEIAGILRPHATKATAKQAKPPRQWTSTPPQDRGGRWWNAWKNTDGSQYKCLVPLNIDWRDALDQRGTAYDLWLPYLDGDTRDNLPPLPNSSAVVTGSPAPEIAAVVCKQCGSECGDQRYRAPELRGLCDACICGDTPGPADDTRELVARLAECIMDRMEPLPDGMRTDLVAIYRDARRGGAE